MGLKIPVDFKAKDAADGQVSQIFIAQIMQML